MSEEPALINKVPSSLDISGGGATGGAQDTSTQRPERRVTFRGNSYDLTALGAFAGGILVLASCLTCGQIAYCLPIIPLILGVIGLVMARDAVDEKRTRLWSWLGIGGSAAAVILTVFAILSYFVFIAFIIAVSQN